MLRTTAVVASLGLAAAAGAEIIVDGLYSLHNFPLGSEVPPAYGMRLDGLYTVEGSDVFTFDFDHPDSAMFMTIDKGTIHIRGVAFGGRDTGTEYADDEYRGLYTIDFLYDKGVADVPGDDDIWVDTENNSNRGSILTPLGDLFDLVDERGKFDFSFRLGDEDDNGGHRGVPGISGWGWLLHQETYIESSDWLFTAKLIPAPGTISLALAGLAVMATRRRR